MLNARYVLPQALVARSWRFLADRGSHGHEGMLLWAGRATRGAATISRLVIPAQTAIRTAAGVCVAMEMEAQRAMPQSLRAGEEYFIRVHSHPCKAFHSDADDANLVLSHNGAISIVVPNFCHNVPTDLTACAVFEYRIGHGWRELDLKERGARFTIV